jgi:ubiquitin-protein ligase
MNPSRLRRLQSDYDRVLLAFSDHPYIKLVQSEGSPAEKYSFEFAVKSLVPSTEGQNIIGTTHRCEVFLPADYPRRPPFCRMTTPVFHPNIDPAKICIGDHWSAGQSLPQLVIRVAEMLCYQSYNTKSPLNAQAAAWAEQNEQMLPLERTDLSAGV